MAVRRGGIGILVLCLLTLAAGTVQAADLGARAMGMGGAYVALADDATAVYWNPAGLVNVSWVSLTPVVAVETTGASSLEKFIEVIDPETTSLPTESFSVTASGNGMGGVIAKRFGVTYMPSASVNATYEADVLPPTLAANAVVYNNTVLSAAFPLAKAPFNLATANVGVNLKFVNGKHYTPPDTWTEGTPLEVLETGQGYALDLGFQGKITDRLRYGLVARDLVRRVTWSGDGPDETVRPTYQAGLAFKAPLGFTVAADVENTREAGKDITRLRAGIEESLFGVLAVRGGVRTSSTGDPTYTVGLGAGLFKFLRLEFAAASDMKDRAEGSLTLVAQF